MLGVDLYVLWRAGRRDLPALAAVYDRAVRDLRRVRHDDAEWGAPQQQFRPRFRDQLSQPGARFDRTFAGRRDFTPRVV